MAKVLRLVFLGALAAAAPAGAQAPARSPAAVDPAAAFERLKALAGTWTGTAMQKDGPRAEVRWEVISARTAVMETLFPGTDHEMRSVYHMDGKDLVLTHYCAMGNQPRMRLSVASSRPDELVFDFAGGTNLDPAKDAHVHSGRIRLVDAEHLEAEWAVYQDGKVGGHHRFFLGREAARR
jgi:hypothetical protein